MSVARRVTIKDVAAAAGLSIATVSNVINHPQIVKPETLERVQDCIARLGFIPDSAARQLRLGVAASIGGIMRDLANPCSAETIRGLDDELRESMWTLMVSGSHSEINREAHYVGVYERQRVAGLTVRPAGRDYSSLEAVAARGLNVVLLDPVVPSPVLSSVSIDHTAGAAMAIKHMLDCGRRHILYLEDATECEATEKVSAGVAAAVREAGLEYDKVVTKIGFEMADFNMAHKAVTKYLQSGAQVDAIFSGDEFMCYGAFLAVNTLGLDPEDFCIVGYGDAKGSGEVLPVTLVHLPFYELGREAAELAMRPTENPTHVMLLPELGPCTHCTPANS
jgi:LacI family transcriptional regulator